MIRFKRMSGLPALGLAAAIASMCGTASAQNQAEDASPQPPAQPADLAGGLDLLIEELASPDFLTRERATVRIRDDRSIRLGDIEALLTSRQLPLEAHSRLVTIARERFATSPRAAMGVQFDLTTLRDRIVIEQTFAPFPCHTILEPGDIVIEADGIPLTSGTARPLIQGLIISRDPGDTMKLVVRRGKEKLSLDVKLGDFRELRNNSLDEVRLYRAWKTRSRNYAQIDEPVATPVHLDAWPDALESSRQRQMQQMRIQPHGPQMVVHAGGRARTSNINDNSWYSTQLRGVNGNRVNAWGANAQALQMVLDFDEPVPQPRMSFAEEVDRLTQKRSLVEAQLERARREAERAMAGTAEAALHASRVLKAELDLRAVERQFDAITAERAEADAARKPAAAVSAESDE